MRHSQNLMLVNEGFPVGSLDHALDDACAPFSKPVEIRDRLATPLDAVARLR